MKMRKGILALVIISAGLSTAWADPVKEVRDIRQQRAQASQKGDLDAFVAPVADNAAVTASRYGFRVDGKQAIRAHYSAVWRDYPTRQGRGRQATYRAYNNGTVVVYNAYVEQSFTDKNGQLSQGMIRLSETWVKTDGRWQQVDLHASKITGIQ